MPTSRVDRSHQRFSFAANTRLAGGKLVDYHRQTINWRLDILRRDDVPFAEMFESMDGGLKKKIQSLQVPLRGNVPLDDGTGGADRNHAVPVGDRHDPQHDQEQAR